MAGAVVASCAVSGAVAHADAPATATPVPVLQRGGSANGTLVNNGGGGSISSYTINGDGDSVTLNATFSGADPNNTSAFLNVWGPFGSVASVNPSSGAAGLAFPTTAGQTYTVIVAVYQPIAQTDFTVSAK